MDKQLEMFKRLTEAKSVPGNERDVRNLMKEYLTPVSYTHLTLPTTILV